MTREEILNQGRPVEPNHFETDREEQWYKVGLYDGATARIEWHTTADMPETGMVAFAGVDGKFDYMEQNVATAIKVIKKTYRQHRIFGVLTSRQQLGRGDYRGEGGDKKTYSHILLSRMPKNNIKCAIIKYKQLNINIL